MRDWRSLGVMFGVFFKVGLFTFGGGYAMVPIIRREMVDRLKWVSDDEFLDMLALAQASPGPVAVNTSILVGHKIAGYGGSAVALAGTVLPSFLVILAIAGVFDTVRSTPTAEAAFAGVRPAVAALVLGAAWSLGSRSVRTPRSAVIAVAAFLAVALLRIHPAIVIIMAGVGAIFEERPYGHRKQEGH
ncbi:MAG: chromate transporter [Bacillota bacterium]